MSDTLARIADHLKRRRDAVLAAWRSAADRDPTLTTAGRLSRAEFNDHIPHALDALDRALRGRDGASGDEAATEHGSHRWQQGYGLGELVCEFGHLHGCLIREVDEFARGDPAADPADVTHAREVVARAIHTGVTTSVSRYHKLQQAEAAGRVRALEAALSESGEEEKARGEALRAASHDLRGGLSIVSMSAALLDMQGLPDGARQKSVKRLMGGLSSIQEMLNDLADLSRLEAGQERREVAWFDAARTLTDLCTAARSMAEGKGLYLRAEGPGGLEVEGDEGEVRRLAQNLVINALKYTTAGGVTVRWEDCSPAAWRFRVEDTGPGLPTGSQAPLAAELKSATRTARAAEGGGQGPIRPAPTSTATTRVRAEGGEGIGLSIVKRLCELLDAGLELESRPGQGSTFRVTLPSRYDGTARGGDAPRPRS